MHVPPILLLPSELKHRIAELSSPSSLASLARTHTAYKIEAEQVLYHTISFLTANKNSLRCMDTLATNSEKAAFVRFLTFGFSRLMIKQNRHSQAMTYFLKALINMHSLSDLRLQMPDDQVYTWIDDLHKVLCEGHFRLRTLYCSNVLDYSQIIKSQPDLQILGINSDHSLDKLLETFKQLHDAQLPFPIAFQLDHPHFIPVSNTINIFPTFYSIDRCATIPQVLAKCFNENDQDSGLHATYVKRLSVYLVDSSDMPNLHVCAKDMGMNFPQILSLHLFMERQCEIPSQEIKKILPFFPNLYQLGFFSFWPEVVRKDVELPKDVKVTHAKEWKIACPALLLLIFPDGSVFQIDSEGGWGPVE